MLLIVVEQERVETVSRIFAPAPIVTSCTFQNLPVLQFFMLGMGKLATTPRSTWSRPSSKLEMPALLIAIQMPHKYSSNALVRLSTRFATVLSRGTYLGSFRDLAGARVLAFQEFNPGFWTCRGPWWHLRLSKGRSTSRSYTSCRSKTTLRELYHSLAASVLPRQIASVPVPASRNLLCSNSTPYFETDTPGDVESCKESPKAFSA